MAKNIIEYDILISCPGDVIEEIDSVNEAINKFNDLYTKVLKIRLTSKHWSKDSYNQSGGKAQSLLNKQLVNECDAAVAIFWTRFGTPTDKYGSGTEEEISELIESGKQVFMYFSSKPIPPDDLLEDKKRKQYEKVKAYQQRYAEEGKGIYSTFVSTEDFQDKLFAHLSMHFLTAMRLEELSNTKQSKLNIKGIDGNDLCDTAISHPFMVAEYKSSENMMEEIIKLYGAVEKHHICRQRAIESSLMSSFHRKVEIKEDTKEIIASFAKNHSIVLSGQFFELGSLSRDPFSSNVLTGPSFNGEPQEMQKYNDIIKLRSKIVDLIRWSQFENLFKTLNCIKLVVINDGTTYDEDIDIVLRFENNAVLFPKELPIPDERTAKYIMDNCSLEDIFSIYGTLRYSDYQSSITTPTQPYMHNLTPQVPVGLLGSSRDYNDDYQDGLSEVFDYDFFVEGNESIAKLHIDYLKHNTAVAFPTVLFVKENLCDIRYTIKSKYSDSIIEGILQVGEMPT